MLITSCQYNYFTIAYCLRYAGVAELADALDLGSSTFGVQVQLLSPAPFNIMKDILTGMSFLLFFN